MHLTIAAIADTHCAAAAPADGAVQMRAVRHVIPAPVP